MDTSAGSKRPDAIRFFNGKFDMINLDYTIKTFSVTQDNSK